jgi:hypothetical protein
LKTFRIQTITLGLFLTVCVFPLQSHAEEANKFTANDLRIALLLDTLGSVIEVRDRNIDDGTDPENANTEARLKSTRIIQNLNELTTSKHLIDLLEAESTRLQDLGLRAAHPTIRRLTGMIEALKFANEAKKQNKADMATPRKPSD